MTKLLVIAQATIIALTLAAGFAHAETVKKGDLPATLKGAKVKAEKSPIPTCFAGDRAKLASTDPLLTEWVASHEKHACASASTLYVCRSGKNLSVRCE
jgi:hypothetical protein